MEIFPDFPNGGLADFTQYNDGLRGGKVRVRAGIEISVLSIGTFLGGIFGIGTVMFAIGIGPILAICLGFVKKWSI